MHCCVTAKEQHIRSIGGGSCGSSGRREKVIEILEAKAWGTIRRKRRATAATGWSQRCYVRAPGLCTSFGMQKVRVNGKYRSKICFQIPGNKRTASTVGRSCTNVLLQCTRTVPHFRAGPMRICVCVCVLTCVVDYAGPCMCSLLLSFVACVLDVVNFSTLLDRNGWEVMSALLSTCPTNVHQNLVQKVQPQRRGSHSHSCAFRVTVHVVYVRSGAKSRSFYPP